MSGIKGIVALVISLLVLAIAGYFAVSNKLFADIASKSVELYKISNFPNTQGHKSTVAYDRIDLGKKEKITEITVKIPRAETEGFTVMLSNNSSLNFSDLTVEKSDLTNASGKTISKDLIDERVLHSWATKQFDRVEMDATWKDVIDELLVKNEKTNFLSTDVTSDIKTQFNSNGGTAKDSDPSEPITTSLEKNKTKKFYFKVTAPVNEAGDFRGTINFVDKTTKKTLSSFELNLKVLDIDIVEPEQAKTPYYLGCYNNDKVLSSDSSRLFNWQTNTIDEDVFRKRMKKAREYGCNTLVQRIGPYVDNVKALEIISETGFTGPVILNYYYYKQKGDKKIVDTLDTVSTKESKNEFTKIAQEIINDRKITVPVMFYGIDEPNSDTEIPEHIKKVKNIESIIDKLLGDKKGKTNIINKTTTSLTTRPIPAFQEAGIKTEFPLVNFREVDQYLKGVREGTIYKSDKDAYYFQGWMEYPTPTRLISGFGLVNSGMTGSFINPLYGYYGVNGRPLYDDFTTTEPEPVGLKTWRKPFMTFYPATDGYIPTYQAEARREGVLDLRYYLTYQKNKANLGSCSSKVLSDLGRKIDSNLKKFKNDPINSTKLPAGLNTEDFDILRNDIKDYLIENNNSCKENIISLKTGFNSFGSTFKTEVDKTLLDNTILFKFKSKAWQISEKEKIEVNPRDGLYVYNPGKEKELKITGSKHSQFDSELEKGWNLLSAHSDSDLSNFKVKISGGNCNKVVPLRVLIKSFASDYIPIIVDGNAETAEKAFKYLGAYNGDNFLNKIPKDKQFWLYLFSQPDPKNKDFNLYPCL